MKIYTPTRCRKTSFAVVAPATATAGLWMSCDTTYKAIQGYIGTYIDAHGDTHRIFKDIHKYTRIFKDVQPHTKIFTDFK